MTDQEREALEEILRKATAPEYGHQSLNLMAGRMEEIGKVARAALAAREEPQGDVDDREWTLTQDFEHPRFGVADGPSLGVDERITVVPKSHVPAREESPSRVGQLFRERQDLIRERDLARAERDEGCAAREEPPGDNDLEVSRLLLQLASEREGKAVALAERDEALGERDEAEDYRVTVSDELVERVAKAIFEAGRGPHRVRSGDRDTPQFPWEKVPATPKTGYRMQARAAIAVVVAAREDTERPDGETCECDSCNRAFPLSVLRFGRGGKATCPECVEGER